MANPIKILLLATDIDFAETNEFIKIHQSGCEVKVVCDPEAVNKIHLINAGLNVVEMHIARRFDRDVQLQLKDILNAETFDVIHVLRKPMLLNVLKLKKYFPSSKLVAYRGIVGNLSFFDPYSWMSFLHPRIDKIICVADAIRRHFVAMNFLGFRFPENRFVTIHKGHDTRWYEFSEKFDFSEFGIPADAKTIGCVASFRARKGGWVLVDAFNKLPDSLNCYLFLIGDINDKRLSRAIETSPKKSRIIATGFRKDARQISGSLDVFVLPSLKREGLPRSVIESMSQGVPAIVSDAGGSPEVVEHGKTGYVVPAGDASAITAGIKGLLSDPKKYAEFSQASRERIQSTFNIDQTVSKTLALYKQLLGLP